MSKRLIAMLLAAGLGALPGDAPGERDKRDAGKEVRSRPTRRAERRGRGLARRRGGRDRPGRQMTQQQEEELLSAIKKWRPGQYRRLTKLREDRPHVYRMALRRIWPRYEELKGMSDDERQRAMAGHEARLRIWRLLQEAGRAPNSETKKRVIGELREPVSKVFEAEQARLENRLTRLEEEIRRVRQELKERAQRKDEIITERIERMLKTAARRPRRPRDGLRGRPARDGDGPGDGPPE